MIIIATQNIKLCPIVFLSISDKIIIFDIKHIKECTLYCILNFQKSEKEYNIQPNS